MRPTMCAVFRCAGLVACAVFLAHAVGCSSATTRFYALTAVSRSANPPGGVTVAAPALGVGPVSVPERLNRPEIVTWVDQNRLHLAELDQWAAPLQDSVTRVLAENLSVLVPTDRVAVFPWLSDVPIDVEVRVEIVRFEGRLGQDCALVARWTLFRRTDRQATAGRSSHTEPAGKDYASLVAAQSRLLAALSRDIATALASEARAPR